jgi:hypothetical protein
MLLHGLNHRSVDTVTNQLYNVSELNMREIGAAKSQLQHILNPYAESLLHEQYSVALSARREVENIFAFCWC